MVTADWARPPPPAAPPTFSAKAAPQSGTHQMALLLGELKDRITHLEGRQPRVPTDFPLDKLIARVDEFDEHVSMVAADRAAICARVPAEASLISAPPPQPDDAAPAEPQRASRVTRTTGSVSRHEPPCSAACSYAVFVQIHLPALCARRTPSSGGDVGSVIVEFGVVGFWKASALMTPPRTRRPQKYLNMYMYACRKLVVKNHRW